MAEKQQQPYIRERVIANVEASKKARDANNEGKGLNYDEHKFSGKNFDRLAEQRGQSKQETQEAKASFNKWAGENKDPKMDQTVTAKHSRPEGEKAYVYSSKGTQGASGRYSTPEKFEQSKDAKEKLASPTYNQMDQRHEVRVKGDQIRGTVAPQKEWTKEVAKNGDSVERKGGGTQIYTQGYEKGSVSNVDEYGVDISKADKTQSTSKGQSKGDIIPLK